MSSHFIIQWQSASQPPVWLQCIPSARLHRCFVLKGDTFTIALTIEAVRCQYQNSLCGRIITSHRYGDQYDAYQMRHHHGR